MPGVLNGNGFPKGGSTPGRIETGKNNHWLQSPTGPGKCKNKFSDAPLERRVVDFRSVIVIRKRVRLEVVGGTLMSCAEVLESVLHHDG
jgi:hypothetical protein